MGEKEEDETATVTSKETRIILYECRAIVPVRVRRLSLVSWYTLLNFVEWISQPRDMAMHWEGMEEYENFESTHYPQWTTMRNHLSTHSRAIEDKENSPPN